MAEKFKPAIPIYWESIQSVNFPYMGFIWILRQLDGEDHDVAVHNILLSSSMTSFGMKSFALLGVSSDGATLWPGGFV